MDRLFDCLIVAAAGRVGDFTRLGLVLGLSIVWCGCTRVTDQTESNEIAEPTARPQIASEETTTSVDTGTSVETGTSVDTGTSGGTGVIEGTVRFVGGRIPVSTLVPVAADLDYCGPNHSMEDYVVDAASGGIRYVIVRLKGEGVRNWPNVEPGFLRLDNKNCRYEPHAAVLTVGSTLELHNSDIIYHTNHAYFGASFNFALAKQGDTAKVVLDAPGLIQIRCDKHGWMNSFIHVDRHPLHAVTDDQGRFKISGVPAGKYTISAWHEKFARTETAVIVRAGETTRQELTYSIRGKNP